MVFSPEGLIGLLVPALAGTALGGLLIKRPGDKSQKEVKETLYTEEEVEKIRNGDN